MKTKKSESLGKDDSSASQAKEKMTTHMENRKETVRPKLLLTPRRPTTIATWNVRTMYAGGKTVIVDEMRRYNLSLLGLGETRWLQTGQVNLAPRWLCTTYRGSRIYAFLRSTEGPYQLETHQLKDHHSQIPQYTTPPPTTQPMKPRITFTADYTTYSRPRKKRT